MTASPAIDPDGHSSWLSPFTLCCAPLASCLGRGSRRSRASDQDLLIDEEEKPLRSVVHQQPAPQGRPAAGTEPDSFAAEEMDRPPRKSGASNRTMSTLKKRFRSDGSVRRPRISGPSDFRHLETGSFQFPPTEPPVVARPRQDRPARPSSFRPLELSIYMPDNQMSPILPHFEFSGLVPPPEPAQLRERLDDDHELIREQSNSTPFHLPRKPGTETLDSSASAIPPRSQARARAHTSPELESIKARVAGAMIEVERLQKQIDDVMERQSVYACSRPSTSHSMARTMAELEPMPSIPALPPAAPSFAARLDMERPQTAPLRTNLDNPNRSQESSVGKTAATSPHHPKYEDSPLPPPLPLAFRPPLRKKKSFSHVSTWLFPNGQHRRDLSLDSVTNHPHPVKGTEGFYQCVAPGDQERRSFDSVGTVSTWDSEEEHRTVPTTLSLGSTPLAKQDGPPLERSATFGRNEAIRPTRPIVEAVG